MDIQEIQGEDEREPFIASRDEELDKKAFMRACLMSERSSVLMKLADEKQINQTMGKMKNFDFRVVSLINKWSNSTHPEEEADMVFIGGKSASEYMKENGYSFRSEEHTSELQSH